mmetsp:Transcript_27545/g.58582  ORF Transcript_27545/g.58582 Transcript_27545/m.58582 type:complete len:82 (-) Transcript_27545:2748-2993(-)
MEIGGEVSSCDVPSGPVHWTTKTTTEPREKEDPSKEKVVEKTQGAELEGKPELVSAEQRVEKRSGVPTGTRTSEPTWRYCS